MTHRFEYQLLLNPVVLGSGRTMFDGVPGKIHLALKKTRSFGNGNIVSWYAPGESFFPVRGVGRRDVCRHDGRRRPRPEQAAAFYV